MNRLSKYSPYALTALRIMVGLLFIEHGTLKLLGFPSGGNPMPGLFTLLWAQGLVELIGGLLFTVGFVTPAVAFVLCGDMAVAYFMAHAPRSFFPVVNQGDAAILYCFVFLYFVFAGSGPYSVDDAMKRR